MAKKLKWNLILMSVLYLGLGIFLLMRPSTALNVVCYALGGVVLVCAAVQLVRYFAVERGIFQSQLIFFHFGCNICYFPIFCFAFSTSSSDGRGSLFWQASIPGR